MSSFLQYFLSLLRNLLGPSVGRNGLGHKSKWKSALYTMRTPSIACNVGSDSSSALDSQVEPVSPRGTC